jgi:PIN domain nuclease of toxin-antitoxin system
VSKIVLDASAILTVLSQERGSAIILPHLPDAAVSTVNLAEVHSKLVSRGVPEEDAWEYACSVAPEIFNFDDHQARLTGALVPQTQTSGLSLGDRACLALGIILQAPVYTTDRAWKNLKLGIKIHVVR